MKARYKIAVVLAVVVGGAWVATPYLGPAKIRYQIYEEAEHTPRPMIDPQPPHLRGISSVTVQPEQTPFPLYFQATLSVRGRSSHWGDLAHEKEPVEDEWGYDETATYLYTPWRVYQLKVTKISEFQKRGLGRSEKIHEEERKARQREAELVELKKKQEKEEPNQASEPTAPSGRGSP